MQNIILLVGTMVGAGFASGKEIVTFFLSSNQYAIIGLVLSNAITGIIIYKTICIVKEKQIQNYKQFICYITPPKLQYLATIGNHIINLFLLISFYIMIAGFATYFKQEFTCPMIIGILAALIFVYIACNSNIKGITKINNILIPILIIVIIHIWLKNVDNTVVENIILEEKEGNFIHACMKAILYSSYNSIMLIPIVMEIAKVPKIKAKKIAVGTGIILLLLGYFLTTLLFQGASTNILKKDLPVLEVVSIMEPDIQKIYGIMIAIAIITSAISAVYGYLKNVSTSKKNYKKKLTTLCITAIPIAYIGFSNLINTLYPIFGMLGCIQIVLLFVKKASR